MLLHAGQWWLCSLIVSMSELSVIDKDTPAQEVQLIHGQIARIGGRLRPCAPLSCFDEHQCCHELALELADDRDQAVLAGGVEIVDVSQQGLAIRCVASLAEGQRVWLRGCSLKTGRRLFSEQLLVGRLRCKEPASGAVPERAVYGVSTLADGQSLLYKAILDSLFLAHARDRKE